MSNPKNGPPQPQLQDSPQCLAAVIFDLDGVLVTTDQYHYRAWKALADDLQLEFDRNVNHQLRGISREDSLRAIYRHNPDTPLPDDETFAAQCAWKNARYVELLQDMTADAVLPGAVGLLRELRAAGIRTGIASASKNAGTVIDRTGLAPYIDARADGHCVERPKPDPEVFLVAAERLRVAPRCCIGVEDAESGIEAIRRAGMPAVAIGEQAGGGDLTVAGVDALTVDMLRGLWLRT